MNLEKIDADDDGPRVPLMRRHESARVAFTLVETVVALAVVATVLMALVALLPSGLGQYREAADEEAVARITSAVVGELQMMEWDSLPARLDGSDFESEYDQKGSRTSGTGAVYAVRARSAEGARAAIPGDVGPQPWLRRVEIAITRRPGASDRFDDAARLTRRVVMIAKMDR